MFKVWLEKRKIKAKFDLWLPDLFLQTDEKIKKELEYALKYAVENEVKKFIELEIDKEVCRKIAKEFIEKFDVKPILEEGIQKKFEQYVHGLLPGNQQSYLTQLSYQQLNSLAPRKY